MDISPQIKDCMERSVLCWLATVSADLIPNVSPKEIFTDFGKDCIIIANIASPQTVKNIEVNGNVCLSFIDVLVQKGYQLKGKARIVRQSEPDFAAMEADLLKLTEGKFPFASITEIKLEQAKPILAPRYLIYPETSEEEQIQSARKSYGF